MPKLRFENEKTYVDIPYKDKTYPARMFADEEGNPCIIATTSLSDKIIDPEDCIPLLREQEVIDDNIYYYISEFAIDESEEVLLKHLNEDSELELRSLTKEERERYDRYGNFWYYG